MKKNTYMPPEIMGKLFRCDPIERLTDDALLKELDDAIISGFVYGVEPHSGHRITLSYAALYALRESIDWQRAERDAIAK